MTHLSPYSQTWGKHLDQMLEALPQALGKGLKYKHKCFKKLSTKQSTIKMLIIIILKLWAMYMVVSHL